MKKARDTKRHKDIDDMLRQSARSRFAKAEKLMGDADDLLPVDALGGSAADLRFAAQQLNEAANKLSECLACRKMLGVD